MTRFNLNSGVVSTRYFELTGYHIELLQSIKFSFHDRVSKLVTRDLKIKEADGLIFAPVMYDQHWQPEDVIQFYDASISCEMTETINIIANVGSLETGLYKWTRTTGKWQRASSDEVEKVNSLMQEYYNMRKSNSSISKLQEELDI